MTRAEKIAAWNALCQSGITLDEVLDRYATAVADATRAEMQELIGPFRVPKLENLA